MASGLLLRILSKSNLNSSQHCCTIFPESTSFPPTNTVTDLCWKGVCSMKFLILFILAPLIAFTYTRFSELRAIFFASRSFPRELVTTMWPALRLVLCVVSSLPSPPSPVSLFPCVLISRCSSVVVMVFMICSSSIDSTTTVLHDTVKYNDIMVWATQESHDDVTKWKHFPRYWPFVRGIHQSPVNSPHKPVTRSFDVFFDLCLNKRLSKQSRGWWFETSSSSLWRHCNAETAYCTCFMGYVVQEERCIQAPFFNYSDVIMSTVASQVTSDSIVYSTVCSKLCVTGLCYRWIPCTNDQ